jgi:hypothetical protein
MKTYKKKGSLSLSVNAIVVLVLAITMLGLGIAFTRNMFGNLQQRLFENIEFSNVPDPTNNNPFSIENMNVHVDAGKSTSFGIKILNTLSGTHKINISTSSGCDDVLTFIPTEISGVQQGTFVQFGGIIQTRDSNELKVSGGIKGCPMTVFIGNITDNRTLTNTVAIYAR